MGEFVELETVGGGGGAAKFLDGYHLVVIRGVEEFNNRDPNKWRGPTIEVFQ